MVIMELISMVKAKRVNPYQLSFTIPKEVVTKLGLEGGEKYLVFLNENNEILFQKAAA